MISSTNPWSVVILVYQVLTKSLTIIAKTAYSSMSTSFELVNGGKMSSIALGSVGNTAFMSGVSTLWMRDSVDGNEEGSDGFDSFAGLAVFDLGASAVVVGASSSLCVVAGTVNCAMGAALDRG